MDVFDDFKKMIKSGTFELSIFDDEDWKEVLKLTIADFLGSVTITVSELLVSTLSGIVTIYKNDSLKKLDDSMMKFAKKFIEKAGKDIGNDYGMIMSALETIMSLAKRFVENSEISPVMIPFTAVLRHLMIYIYGCLVNLRVFDTKEFSMGAKEFKKLYEEVLMPNYNIDDKESAIRLLVFLMNLIAVFTDVVGSIVIKYTSERVMEIGGVKSDEVPDERA